MAHWVRFETNGRIGFGIVEGETIAEHAGDMFAGARSTARSLALSEVRLLTPTVPSKMIALWNNFHALAAKMKVPEPEEPLYFLKANNSFLAAGETIRRPRAYAGKVTYEGELGIVIGKQCKDVPEAEIAPYIFGYTCVNDVTAVELIGKDPTFAQWVRAKSFDTFGVFGPAVVTGLDPMTRSLRTVLNGQERQNYPLADMIFPPGRLVSLLSHDMTLHPGDVIAVGTSLGVGSMKEPRNTIEVSIEGVGTLSNIFEQ